MNKVKGNLIDLAKANEFDVIVHGCNCFCTMGAGIAKDIREEFPDAWLADQETKAGDQAKIGTYTLGVHKSLIIVNAYTQYRFNRGNSLEKHDHFEYDGFRQVLKKLAIRFGCFRFGLPYIGMGLAGGNSQRILQIIEDFSKEVEALGGSVTLVEFDAS